MNNLASRKTLAAVAFATVACLLLLVVVSVPVAEAGQQSAVNEEEIEARVRAELEARLGQLNSQLERSLVAMQARLAGREFQRADELERVGEITRRALESAERAMQRAGQFSTITLRGGCGLYGEQVLDFAEDLELTDDQVEQIRSAQRSVRRDRIERNADVEVGEMDLEVLYEADTADLVAIRAKLEELAALDVDGKMAAITLRQQVRRILTPAQQESFDDMRQDGNVRFVLSSGSSFGRVSRMGC